MKKLAPWIFLLAIGLGPVSAAVPVSNPETLVILLRNPLKGLDPALSYDLGTYMILGNVYESLLSFGDGPEDLRPWLSREVPTKENGLVSADGRSYSFPIRSGVNFHQGGTLTAEDVRYSLLREMLIQEQGATPSLLLEPLARRIKRSTACPSSICFISNR